MAKEVAQTVGGKRIALLVAILAAFAVFATLGNRLAADDAKATVTAANLTSSPASGNPVTGGQPVSLTLTATNNNGSKTLTINADPRVQITSSTCPGGTIATFGNSVACTAPVGSDTLTVNGTIAPQPNGAADIAMSSTAQASDVDGALAVTGSPVLWTLRTPTLAVSKVDNADPVQAGSSGSYLIGVGNTDADQAATNVVVTDVLPAEFTPTSATPSQGTCNIVGQTVTCNLGTINAGANATVNIAFQVQTNIVSGTVVNNVANVTASNILGAVASNNQTTQINSVAQILFEIVPSESVVTSNPPELFAWNYVIKNIGTAPVTMTAGAFSGTLVDGPPTLQDSDVAQGPQTVDPFPQNVAGCPVGGVAAGPAPWGCPALATGTTLDAGATQIIPITVRVDPGTPNGTLIFQHARFWSPETGSIDSVGEVAVVNNPILNISKSFSTATVGHAQQSTYTWTVTNVGSNTANNVVVTDAVPAGLTGSNPTASSTGTVTGQTCTLSGGGATTMAAGSSISCTVTVVLAAGSTPAAGAAFQNTASVTSTEMPQAISASAFVTAALPELTITKTSSGTVNHTAGSGTFTITITNTGTAAAGTVTLRDAIDPRLVVGTITGSVNCTAGNLAGGCTAANSLAVGQSVTITIPVGLTGIVPNGTVIPNSATASTANTAPVSANANITASTGNLTITKSNSPLQVGPNGIVTSTIVVTNNGSQPVNNVSITDVLAAGTTFVASGSSTECTAVGQTVTCTVGTLAVGQSVTRVVRFNVGTASGALTNTATASGTNVASVSASATVNGVANVTAGLVHLDVDAASESAAHGETATDPNQVLHEGNNEANPPRIHDNDNATGSLHTVCLVSLALGANDQANIVWNIQPTPGSQANVNPAPAGTKSILALDSPDLDPNTAGVQADSEANCVSWRSSGEGGQTVTAQHTVTGQIFYAAGGAAGANQPLIVEWNSLDSTKIVRAEGVVGAATLFGNTRDLASWSNLATGGTCVRDNDLRTTDVDCLARDNVDANVTNTSFTSPGSTISTGPSAGLILAAPALSFIDYVLGAHDGVILQPEYSGPIDGARQTYTISGLCGSARIEDPVTGATTVIANDGPGGFASSVTVLSSDKGVGFTIASTNNGDPVATLANADCQPGESTRITIRTQEDVQLRSDLDTTPDEVVEIIWTVAPPPAKKVFLAWAGQRVILEQDWRIGPATGNDVADGTDTGLVVDPAAGTQCPVPTGEGGEFNVQYLKGAGPGNFLPNARTTINGNDHAIVRVEAGLDQQVDYNPPPFANVMCISRVLYESEDPGEVDIEAFIDVPGVNLSKVAFVIYYMKFESVVVSIVDDVAKPSHNGPDNASNDQVDTLPGSNGDYAPGNPWDASKDVSEFTANVSKDVLVRGRVKGWFLNSNPSGRAADASNQLNVLPANRWVMPDDWDLLAGGPHGEEVKGTAEEFRPEYDLMTAPNNANGALWTCLTVTGPCASGTSLVGTTTVYAYGVAAPVEGPFSLLDVRGSGVGGAAVWSGLSLVRNTILPDGDVDWWDAPMPPAMVTVDIRGSGFIKQVRKQDVYWTGTANPTVASCAPSATDPRPCQDYPNQFYWVNIPDSAFIPAVVAGGGFLWNTWGAEPHLLESGQGPYNFWWPVQHLLDYTRVGGGPNANPAGLREALTAAENAELNDIRAAYRNTPGVDPLDTRVNNSEANSIGRTLVVYSDNHGEFMVTANGDFKLTYADCDANILGGGRACAQGDLVGSSTINATVDYPDFRGKHFPVKSNTVDIDWTWGGYKTVSIEQGEADQFRYIVFRAVDRDGFCAVPRGSVSLHPVLSSADAANKVGANDPIESVDFLIDAGEGIITNASSLTGLSGLGTSPNFVAPSSARLTPAINEGKQFAVQIPTYSTALNTTIKEFTPLNNGADECQAWIRVSNSLLGILNVLVVAHNDEGDLGFDTIVDFQDTLTYDLTFRWSLITWLGQDGISPTDALKGTVGGAETNDIFDQVTAIYGWNQAAQEWLGFFPAGVGVPGANDLTRLNRGDAYWIAIKGPGNVTWTIATHVN